MELQGAPWGLNSASAMRDTQTVSGGFQNVVVEFEGPSASFKNTPGGLIDVSKRLVQTIP